MVSVSSSSDVAYIVLDTVRSRRDPAASVEIKVRRHFSYVDSLIPQKYEKDLLGECQDGEHVFSGVDNVVGT